MINYIDEINRLKKEKNAIILAHYYCQDEVQDIADYLGDSLYLSQIAKDTTADIIVFCGVHFMAETAKILNPNKKVLLPVMEAGCKMADTINRKGLEEYKKNHPNTKIITYVNTTAEVKALSDCSCTSTNALKIIKHYLDAGCDILYAPDQNLGKYAMSLANTKFDVWPGCCPIHHNLKPADVELLKKQYPNALVIAHPECQPSVLELADYVGSTKQMLAYTVKSDCKEFIVCTEEGILHEMAKASSDKHFIIASPKLSCHDMKLTKLSDVYNVLLNETNEVHVEEETRIRALNSLDKMLELSK